MSPAQIEFFALHIAKTLYEHGASSPLIDANFRETANKSGITDYDIGLGVFSLHVFSVTLALNELLKGKAFLRPLMAEFTKQLRESQEERYEDFSAYYKPFSHKMRITLRELGFKDLSDADAVGMAFCVVLGAPDFFVKNGAALEFAFWRRYLTHSVSVLITPVK